MFSKYESIGYNGPEEGKPGCKVDFEGMRDCVESKFTTWSSCVKYNPEAYIVSEKVHGSNFALVVTLDDGQSIEQGLVIKAARRNDILGDEEVFFKGWKTVVAKYKERCRQVAEWLYSYYDTTQVIVYGELFGGGFPGMESKPIQPEILYRPDLEFYVFDVAYFVNGTKQYVGTEEFYRMMEVIGFEYWARPLFMGTFEDALLFPVDTFKSTVSLDKETEIEGVVIHCDRFKCKVKSTKFQETVRNQYKPNPVTLARLDSVVSKMGRGHSQGQVVAALLADIENEFPGESKLWKKQSHRLVHANLERIK